MSKFLTSIFVLVGGVVAIFLLPWWAFFAILLLLFWWFDWEVLLLAFLYDLVFFDPSADLLKHFQTTVVFLLVFLTVNFVKKRLF